MHFKFKIILLFFLIYFQILYSNDIFLSKRSGEYYDNFGRKLTIDNFGYGIFEEKGIKSESFKIGQHRSVETNYKFTMIFGGRYYANTYLYFTDKNNCIFIINGYLKYYFNKDN